MNVMSAKTRSSGPMTTLMNPVRVRSELFGSDDDAPGLLQEGLDIVTRVNAKGRSPATGRAALHAPGLEHCWLKEPRRPFPFEAQGCSISTSMCAPQIDSEPSPADA